MSKSDIMDKLYLEKNISKKQYINTFIKSYI